MMHAAGRFGKVIQQQHGMRSRLSALTEFYTDDLDAAGQSRLTEFTTEVLAAVEWKISMKWYWLTPHTPRTDVFLIHEYDLKTDQETLLPRFNDLRRCESCGKWDEEHMIETGFDQDRILSVGTDFWGRANDVPQLIVRECVKNVFADNELKGVKFVPCGKNRKGQRLFVFWPTHESRCLAPPQDWAYFRGGRFPALQTTGKCSCGRGGTTLGFPYHFQMEYPDPLTVSIPDVRTESRLGVDFLFLCSKVVRDIIRREKFSGVCLTDVKKMADDFPPQVTE